MFRFVNSELDISHKLDYASSPMDEYGKHMHIFYELILFLRGDVDYHVESELRHLKSGDIVLINPGKLHFAAANHNIGYERYVLKFPASMLPDYLKAMLKDNKPFYSSNAFIESIIKNFDTLHDTYNEDDFATLIKSKIIEICVSLKNAKQGVMGYKNDDIISVLVDYIQAHIKDDLTLAKLSENLHYSESYLSNLFKKEMHCSLMKYIKTKKIILAQIMIREGKKAVDVCEELKFNDYSTFYRTYVKVLGVSPILDKFDRS